MAAAAASSSPRRAISAPKICAKRCAKGAAMKTSRRSSCVSIPPAEAPSQAKSCGMAGRKGKIQNIDEVAKGRIFVARDAQKLGMVDEVGGLSDAVKYAASMAKLPTGQYETRIVPAQRTLLDLIRQGAAADEMTPLR